jgi:hypothetical protein
MPGGLSFIQEVELEGEGEDRVTERGQIAEVDSFKMMKM